MLGKRIVVLGGGIGGTVVSGRLRKKLAKEHSVVLIDQEKEFKFAPSFLWLMMGWRKPEQVTRDLSRLEGGCVKFINSSVSEIDPAEQSVSAGGRNYSFDYLVLSLGADLAPETVPGLFETAHHVYNVEAALKFAEALRSFKEGTIAMGISRIPFKCPAAPYEAAFLTDYVLRKRGIRGKVQINFFTPEPQPMPVAGPAVGGMVRQMLESRGIHYYPNQKLTAVEMGGRQLVFEKGEGMKFDLLFAVPPHRAPMVVKDSGLCDDSGWVPVDRQVLKSGYDNIYAVGDVAGVKLPSGMMLPKAGIFAERQARIVADNLLSEINGTGERRHWDGKGSCFLEVGHGKAGYVEGNFFADPQPSVDSRRPSRFWHWVKVALEKYWLWRHF